MWEEAHAGSPQFPILCEAGEAGPAQGGAVRFDLQCQQRLSCAGRVAPTHFTWKQQDASIRPMCTPFAMRSIVSFLVRGQPRRRLLSPAAVGMRDRQSGGILPLIVSQRARTFRPARSQTPRETHPTVLNGTSAQQRVPQVASSTYSGQSHTLRVEKNCKLEHKQKLRWVRFVGKTKEVTTEANQLKSSS